MKLYVPKKNKKAYDMIFTNNLSTLKYLANNLKFFVTRDFNILFNDIKRQKFNDDLYHYYYVGDFIYQMIDDYVQKLDNDSLIEFSKLKVLNELNISEKFYKKVIQNILFYITFIHSIPHSFSIITNNNKYNNYVRTGLVIQGLYPDTNSMTDIQKEWIKKTNEKYPEYYKKYGYIFASIHKI